MRCCPQQPPCLRVFSMRSGCRGPPARGPQFAYAGQACALDRTAGPGAIGRKMAFCLQILDFLHGHIRYSSDVAEPVCSDCGQPLGWLAVWTEHSGGPRCSECVGVYERLDLRQALKRLGRPSWAPCAVCGRKVVDVRRRGQKRFACSPSCRRRLPAKLRRDARAQRRDPAPARVCRACEEPLTGRRLDARYCSTACRVWAHRYRALLAE